MAGETASSSCDQPHGQEDTQPGQQQPDSDDHGGDGQIVLWPGMALFAWWLPTEATGRAMMVTLAVYAFAGEYRWHTCKNVLPRTDRLCLLMVKYAALVLFGFTACTLYSLVLAAGTGADRLDRRAAGAERPGVPPPGHRSLTRLAPGPPGPIMGHTCNEGVHPDGEFQ